MYASAKNIDNVIAVVDYNGQQIDGATKDVVSLGNLKAKFEAFDWDVLEIKEGNQIAAIIEGMTQAIAKQEKESLFVYCYTRLWDMALIL